MRMFFILILSAVLYSNTFSPQYLIWIAPFVAFLTIWEIGLFVSASTLTWMYFRYWNDVINLMPIVTSLLIARNIVLVILHIEYMTIYLYSLFKRI